MAPEILEGNNNYDEECDLWSLGVIIYRLYFIKYPYDVETMSGIMNLINNYEQKMLKNTENEELNDLIRKLLIKDPKNRMSWQYYFSHSFFKNKTNIINMEIKIEKKIIIEIYIF